MPAQGQELGRFQGLANRSAASGKQKLVPRVARSMSLVLPFIPFVRLRFHSNAIPFFHGVLAFLFACGTPFEFANADLIPTKKPMP